MSLKTYNHCFFTFIFILCSASCFAQLKIKRTPQWVVPQTYEHNPEINLNEISYGLLTLLSDEQIHIPKKERYIRLVRKITDNVGVQEGSSISINYDPTYQGLILHKIEVLREGEIINKLNLNDFQNIRQESNSESYIYDGSLNAIANLADIRNGDILDISYTIKGFNPIHGHHFSGGTTLNSFQPIGKINYYLISDRPLQYKVLNTDLKPTIGAYKGFTTYNWTTLLTKPVIYEDNTPSWYFSNQNVYLSDFKTWGAVVDWALNIYEDTTPSKALQTKIEAIKNMAASEGERISETLQFVQNEIRYLGLESGIGAYKPFSPNKVLQHRFGDCKDKSWLMVTMLRHMNIEAYPVFVNTTYGESLHQFLPTPKIFNHAVVKVVDSTHTNLFYDPTISNQRGNYKSVSFPNYGKALVVKQGVTALEQIASKNEDLIEVFDTYDLPDVGGVATLNVMTVYREGEADLMRARYKSTSLTTLRKNFKNYYDNLYEGVEVLKDPSFDDDTLANKILVEESYKINKIWQPMVGNAKNIMAEFIPYSLKDVIIFPNEASRKAPFGLYYPTHKKHQITVKLPRRWSLAKEHINVNSKNFKFSLKGKMNSAQNILYLNYEYQNKNSYVKPEDFNEYYTKIKEVEQIMAYFIYIPKDDAKALNMENFFNNDTISSLKAVFYWGVGIALAVIIGLVIFVNRSHKNKV